MAKENLKLFHGSPHIVDKFLLRAVGTGEGQQAQGWGLYFSSREDIAIWYAQRLSIMQYEFRATEKQRNEIEAAFPEWKSLVYAYDVQNNRLVDDFEAVRTTLNDFIQNRAIELGYVYEVSVPDGNFLLWDGYVTDKQREVLSEKFDIPERLGGSEAYRILVEVLGSPFEASKWLYSKGIIGVKYMTGETRKRLEGTYFDDANAEWNYVIFSEHEVTMVGIKKVLEV